MNAVPTLPRSPGGPPAFAPAGDSPAAPLAGAPEGAR